jgi:hypothetical protein
MKHMQQWLSDAKAKGIRKAFITFHFSRAERASSCLPTIHRTSIGGERRPRPSRIFFCRAKFFDIQIVVKGSVFDPRRPSNRVHREVSLLH